MQRGRKSAAALAINVSGARPRLTAPAGLTAKERVEFEQLTASCSPDHFRESDIPLLVAMAQATLLARKLGRDSTKINEWERATRVQAMLATKLRMTPQARSDPKTIARMDGGAPWHRLRKPWEMKSDEEKPPWTRDDDELQ